MRLSFKMRVSFAFASLRFFGSCSFVCSFVRTDDVDITMGRWFSSILPTYSYHTVWSLILYKELIFGVPNSFLYKELIFGVPILFKRKHPYVVATFINGSSVKSLSQQWEYATQKSLIFFGSCVLYLDVASYARNMKHDAVNDNGRYLSPAPDKRNTLLLIFIFSLLVVSPHFVDSKKDFNMCQSFIQDACVLCFCFP
jgi:hypothetical protein